MYTKTSKISTLQEEDIVSDIFVLKSKQGLFSYSQDTKNRFELRLGDSTGEITLKFWGEEPKQAVVELYNLLSTNDVIFVQGKVKEFNNSLEINSNHGIHRIEKVPLGEFDPSCFIAKSSQDINALFEELKSICYSVNNQEYKTILYSFFEDSVWATRFKHAPASMYRHYAYIGGLAEHTLSVVKICDKIASIHPEIEKDLLITGAVLHDIGKIEYYSLGTSIEVSSKGALLGHVELGVEEFCKRTKEMNISTITMHKIKHIILSHLGKKSYGSPVTPSFPEAIVISQAKLLDSKTKGIISAITTAKEIEDNDELAYNKDFGRLYLK